MGQQPSAELRGIERRSSRDAVRTCNSHSALLNAVNVINALCLRHELRLRFSLPEVEEEAHIAGSSFATTKNERRKDSHSSGGGIVESLSRERRNGNGEYSTRLGVALWKMVVVVHCEELGGNEGQDVLRVRTLNLRQFFQVKRQLEEGAELVEAQHAANERKRERDTPLCVGVVDGERHDGEREQLYSSDLLRGLVASAGYGGDDDSAEISECPVCMDAKQEVLLECTHGFCAGCIQRWRQTSRDTTCPICRGSASQTEQDWVLMEDNETDDVQIFEDIIKGVMPP